jgi:hypothetical protein
MEYSRIGEVYQLFFSRESAFSEVIDIPEAKSKYPHKSAAIVYLASQATSNEQRQV